MVLKTSVESSIPKLWKKPFRTFLLLILIVKGPKFNSLKIEYIILGISASFIMSNFPFPTISISH